MNIFLFGATTNERRRAGDYQLKARIVGKAEARRTASLQFEVIDARNICTHRYPAARVRKNNLKDSIVALDRKSVV